MNGQSEIPPPEQTDCPICAGPRILADGYGSLMLVPLGEPWAALHGQSSTTYALVCVVCGFTQLYAKTPHVLISRAPNGHA
jgi:hypothetical protein